MPDLTPDELHGIVNGYPPNPPDAVAAAREALADAVSAYALARERVESEQVISERWGAWLRQADAYAQAQAAAARAEAERLRDVLDEADTF